MLTSRLYGRGSALPGSCGDMPKLDCMAPCLQAVCAHMHQVLEVSCTHKPAYDCGTKPASIYTHSPAAAPPL